MLTFPQRAKAIDTFEDLANSEKDLNILVPKSSFQEAMLSLATEGNFKTIWDRILGEKPKSILL